MTWCILHTYFIHMIYHTDIFLDVFHLLWLILLDGAFIKICIVVTENSFDLLNIFHYCIALFVFFNVCFIKTLCLYVHQGSRNEDSQFLVVKHKDRGYFTLQQHKQRGMYVGFTPRGTVRPTIDSGTNNIHVFPEVIECEFHIVLVSTHQILYIYVWLTSYTSVSM